MTLIKLLVAGLLVFLANSAHADPVSAVIAVATMVGSAGAIAATATGILAGISFAGAAVSLIGNVSGNKKLMKIGAIASAGAGLASLATSALNAGTGAANAAQETFRAAELADTANVSAAADAASGASGVTSTAAAETAAADVGRNVAQNGTAASAAPATPAAAATTEAVAPAVAETGGQVTKGTAFGDAAKRAGSFIRDNKELVNLGGGLVKGAMEYKSVRDKYGDARGLAEDERRWIDERRKAYSDSVRAAAAAPMPTVNDVNINQVTPQDPTKRYVPVRGLVNQAAQG